MCVIMLHVHVRTRTCSSATHAVCLLPVQKIFQTDQLCYFSTHFKLVCDLEVSYWWHLTGWYIASKRCVGKFSMFTEAVDFFMCRHWMQPHDWSECSCILFIPTAVIQICVYNLWMYPVYFSILPEVSIGEYIDIHFSYRMFQWWRGRWDPMPYLDLYASSWEVWRMREVVSLLVNYGRLKLKSVTTCLWMQQ